MDQNNEIYQKDLSVFCDAKLLTEDGFTFDVHRIILSHKSKFFYDLFFNFPNDTDYFIPKIRGESLSKVLCFIYNNFLDFHKHNFIDIIRTADFLQIDDVYIAGREYAISVLCEDNCLQIYDIFNKINDQCLRELSFRIIQINFEKLRKLADFAELSVQDLKDILNNNSLLISGENVIWESITEWAKRDPQNRFKEIFCLLKCLKIGDIDEQLANEIIQSDIITKNSFCKALECMRFQKFNCSLDALQFLINNSSESSQLSEIYNKRLPNCLHVIICLMAKDEWNGHPGIYVTHDEKLDFWRQLGEINDHLPSNCVHIIENNIYVFNPHAMNAVKFNLYEEEWQEMESSFSGVLCENIYTVVVGTNIYFICNNLDKLSMKIYKTENGSWFDAMPTFKFADFEAVPLQNKLFILGHIENQIGVLSMLAQVYDEESNLWSDINLPSVNRSTFYFIAYHLKLYIIGKADFDNAFDSAVEVFDVMKNEWERIADLPIPKDEEISFSSVFIFNDQLYAVFYIDIEFHQFVLNETTKKWEIPKRLLPVDDLEPGFEEDLLKFHTIHNQEIINVLVKKSRRSETSLAKSPFK